MYEKFRQFLSTIELNEDMDLPYFGNFKTFVRSDAKEFSMSKYLNFLKNQLYRFRKNAKKSGSMESFQQYLDRLFPDQNTIYPIEEVEV